jgi:hypothetical protein
MLNASYLGFVSTPVVVTLPGPREAFERFDGREGNAAGANVRAASLGARDGRRWFLVHRGFLSVGASTLPERRGQPVRRGR